MSSPWIHPFVFAPANFHGEKSLKTFHHDAAASHVPYIVLHSLPTIPGVSSSSGSCIYSSYTASSCTLGESAPVTRPTLGVVYWIAVSQSHHDS
eukprot:5319202-Amphidinium_carterae.1